MPSENHPSYLGSSILNVDLPDGILINYYPIFIREKVHVVDLGCGNGRNLIQLSNAGLNVTGIDISEDAISLLNQSLQSSTESVSIFRKDIRQVAFDKLLPDKISLVIAANVLNFFTKSTAIELVSKINSNLEIGSYFYITMLTKDDPGLRTIAKKSTLTDDGSYYFEEKNIHVQFFSKADITQFLPNFQIYELAHGKAIDLTHDEPHYHKYISYLGKKLSI